MTKFSDLTRGFNELSDKQYALLRDAGFSPEFISNKKQPFYQLQHKNFPSKSQDVKPTERQIEFIRSQIPDLEEDDDLATYADARYAIRSIAIEQDMDERYIKYINDYCMSKKQKNDERVERRRKQKERDKAQLQGGVRPAIGQVPCPDGTTTEQSSDYETRSGHDADNVESEEQSTSSFAQNFHVMLEDFKRR